MSEYRDIADTGAKSINTSANNASTKDTSTNNASTIPVAHVRPFRISENGHINNTRVNIASTSNASASNPSMNNATPERVARLRAFRPVDRWNIPFD